MGKDFLQSEEWRKFQESVGRRTFNISGNNFHANIIEHKLPIVGRYFYIPKLQHATRNPEKLRHGVGTQHTTKFFFERIIKLAKKENAGWIRVDISNSRILDLIKSVKIPLNPSRSSDGTGSFKKGEIIRKAPHDMQARQVFIIDISKPEGELLARMKAKTRYNIRLAQKKNVLCSMYYVSSDGFDKAMESFLSLVKITSKRNKIKSHSENYYRKMLETIPEKNLKLYAAEYRGKIIAANLVSFYGGTATYLHGASDNKYRNVMAPFLLQWQIMLDAKKAGCKRYDMGGIKNQNDNTKLKNLKVTQATSYKLQADWAGITRFKLGFSPNTKPVEFPGSYDIVINPWRYWIYRMLQKIKSIL